MGGGLVTTSAKTRRCEYSHAHADQLVDAFPSCKHLCCREGVDKAPKAPKSSFVSAASLVHSSHLSGHKGKTGCVATEKKSAAPSVRKKEQEAEIEIVDLASRQTFGAYEKTSPIAFRNLNRLHNNVTKGRSAPVAIQKQPSFDYSKGGQPQISFLNNDARAGILSDKASTDNDADWMGDLPSLSALLGKPQENLDPRPAHTSTDYGSSWSDGLPSLSALIHQNDAAVKSYAGNGSREGVHLSQSNDNDSDLEAAMVGLSDSVTMQENLQVQAATGQIGFQAEASQHCSPPSDELTPKLYHGPTLKAESSGTSRLFFSTNGAEQVASIAQKRKAAVGDGAEDLSQSAPVLKRPRVSDECDQARKRSSSAGEQAQASRPIIKAGQPEWVYGFDAAFIAEWQDIVDFI